MHSKDIMTAGLVIFPISALIIVFIWFSVHTITQGPEIDASLANPIGFLISNFVYDGIINVENIVLSCAFILAIFLFYPRVLKISSALFLPAVALISGAVALLAAVITCNQSCSFYGMSGVAGGIIGYTFANFSIAFGMVFITKSTKRVSIVGKTYLTDKLPRFIIAILLAAYVIMLFLISGFFALHSTTASNPLPVTVQVPASISSAPESVQVGHTTGIAIGFLLCLALFLSSLKKATEPR